MPSSDIKERIDRKLDESPVRDEPRHVSPRPDREGDMTPDRTKKAPQYVVSTLSSKANVSQETAREFCDMVYGQGMSAREAADEMGLKVGVAFDIRDAMRDIDLDPDDYRQKFGESADRPSAEEKFDQWRKSGRIPSDDRADRRARLESLIDEILESRVESVEDLEVAGKKFAELAMLAEKDGKALEAGETLWEAMKIQARMIIGESPEDVGEERPLSEQVDRDGNPFDGWGDMAEYLQGDAVDQVIDRDARQIADVYAQALADLHEGADEISAQLDTGDLLFDFDPARGDRESAVAEGVTDSGRRVALKADVSGGEPYLAFYVRDNDSHVAMRLFESNWMATLPLLMQHSLKAMQAPGYTYSEMQDAEAPAFTSDMR